MVIPNDYYVRHRLLNLGLRTPDNDSLWWGVREAMVLMQTECVNVTVNVEEVCINAHVICAVQITPHKRSDLFAIIGLVPFHPIARFSASAVTRRR